MSGVPDRGHPTVTLVALGLATALHVVLLVGRLRDATVEDLSLGQLLLAPGVVLVIALAAGNAVVARREAQRPSPTAAPAAQGAAGATTGATVLAMTAAGGVALAVFAVSSFWIAHLLLAGLVAAQAVDAIGELRARPAGAREG